MWDGCEIDKGYYDCGNHFLVKDEAQRVADMLNYFFLVQRKAREMGGLLGYGKDVDSSQNPHILYLGNCGFGWTRIFEWPEHQPLTPILTKDCADALAKDRDIVAAAKKAWGVN